MNIELFNKELSNKVARAKNFEKQGKIKSAIDAWVEVSDMSLKFSKSRGIDSSFRNMLLKRTEEILEHIKILKLELTTPYETPEETRSIEDELEKQEVSDTSNDIYDVQRNDMDTSENLIRAPGKIVEIKAPKDFNIITPHKELDMDIFKNNRTIVLNDDNDDKSVLKHNNINKNVICFVCGYDKNPPNAKTCKNCEVDLK